MSDRNKVSDRNTIIRGYNQAGDDFLANDLREIFMLIETADDKALHNDMVRRIQKMIGDVGVNDLRTSVARMLLNRSGEFLLNLAKLIKNLSVRGIQNDEKNKKTNS